MKKNKTILYVGNDLALKTGYTIAMNILSDLLVDEGVQVIKTSHKKNKLLRILDMCYQVFKYKNKVDYILIDFFSTTAFYYGYATSQLARILKLKYIPILHGGNLPFRLDKSPKKCKAIFNYSYKNIAPSNYLKHEFEIRNYKVILIPNVINIEKYPYKERRKLKPRLLYVRAFDRIYNPRMAIEVLDKLKENYSEAKLCMIGPDRDGSLEVVKEIVREKGLDNHVEFTGVLPQKEWHKKSEEFDIFINTTNIDNTPVSVIEAMALGLPIVSTNVGGLLYLIEDKIDGLLIEKGNSKEMIFAIESLLQGDYKDLAVNARKKAEKFSWNVVRKQWNHILYGND